MRLFSPFCSLSRKAASPALPAGALRGFLSPITARGQVAAAVRSPGRWPPRSHRQKGQGTAGAGPHRRQGPAHPSHPVPQPRRPLPHAAAATGRTC
ncbi:unnamed protein product [Urochloa humidicola]